MYSSGVPLKEWVTIHESLSKAIRRAAKVALGKDVSKVQHYTMSGILLLYMYIAFTYNRDCNLSPVDTNCIV